MQKNARTLLTMLLLGVALPIVLTVVGQFFVQVADDKGWYDNAALRWDSAVGEIASVLMSGLVLYPVTALTGLVAGLWLETLLKIGKGDTEPERQSKTISSATNHDHASVATDLDFSIAPLRRIKKNLDRHGGTVDPDDLHRDAMSFRGALKSLEASGFVVPWIDYEVDPIGFVQIGVKFVDRVLPLLVRGHIEEAKAESAKQTADSKRYAAARKGL